MIQCKYHEDMIRGVQYTFMYVHMYIHGGGGMSNVCMYIHEGCTAYVHMYMRGGQCIMKMVHVLGGGGRGYIPFCFTAGNVPYRCTLLQVYQE